MRLTPVDRTTLFLDVYCNLKIRERSEVEIHKRIKTLKALISGDLSRKASRIDSDVPNELPEYPINQKLQSIFKLSNLKYRDRDDIDSTLDFFSAKQTLGSGLENRVKVDKVWDGTAMWEARSRKLLDRRWHMC